MKKHFSLTAKKKIVDFSTLSLSRPQSKILRRFLLTLTTWDESVSPEFGKPNWEVFHCLPLPWKKRKLLLYACLWPRFREVLLGFQVLLDGRGNVTHRLRINRRNLWQFANCSLFAYSWALPKYSYILPSLSSLLIMLCQFLLVLKPLFFRQKFAETLCPYYGILVQVPLYAFVHPVLLLTPHLAHSHYHICCLVAQSYLTAIPRTAARQTSLSFTISLSLLKFMYIESAMASNHLDLCRPLLLPSVVPASRPFPMSWLFANWNQVAKILELQLQHQPFQWIFRTDFL